MVEAGKVQTVLGWVDPGDLGITLPHEQLLLDLRKLYCKPRYVPADSLTNLDLRMENLWKIRQFPYSVLCNLLVESEEEVISELKLFKAAGGGTVCDVSPREVRLRPELLPQLSRETGLHIVAGTADYVDPLQSEETRQMSVREKADVMMQVCRYAGMVLPILDKRLSHFDCITAFKSHIGHRYLGTWIIVCGDSLK